MSKWYFIFLSLSLFLGCSSTNELQQGTWDISVKPVEDDVTYVFKAKLIESNTVKSSEEHNYKAEAIFPEMILELNKEKIVQANLSDMTFVSAQVQIVENKHSLTANYVLKVVRGRSTYTNKGSIELGR